MEDFGAGDVGEVGEVEDFGEAGEVGSQPPDRAGDTYVKDYGGGEDGEVWSEAPGGARRVATCAHRVVSCGCEDPHVRQAEPFGESSVSNYV